MKLVQEYSSHSSRSSRSDSPDLKIDPTPKVDIQSLVVKDAEDRRRSIAIQDEAEVKERKHLTGKVELHAINEQVFREQYYNYNTFGIIVDPEKGGNKYLKKRAGVDNVYDEIDGDEVLTNRLSVFAASSKKDRDLTKIIKDKRTKAGDPSSGDFMGPWAHYEGEEQFDKVNKTAEDIREGMKRSEEDRKQKLEARKQQEEFTPSSTFHGDELYDYKGRSYILPPQDLNIASDTVNYIPKKLVHTYTGHKKGIMVAKFFPKFGHYIISGGYDNEVKIWDVYRDRKCMRTYSGHKNAIKDLSLANDGLHFLSTGWDDRINYWDTETGQVVQTFKLPAHPFCGKLNPDDTKQYMFLVGDVDKRVTQYDIRSGELVCTYNDHLGPVNTVTFVDDNRKFASTSDDKKVFLWEFGIPIVVKHISDPEMHAVTATDLHPEGKYFIGQASDNRVMCYDVKGGTIRLNKKKKFTGHISAGHSIACKVSPDGQFVASGDQDGRVFFWDWKSARVYSVLEAHSKVCIAVDWHPHENSTFLTASWDANIRIWNA